MFAVFQLAGISLPEFGQQARAEGSSAEDLAGLKKARAAMGTSNPAAPIIDTQIAALEKPRATPHPGDTVVLAVDKQRGGTVTTKYTGAAFIDHAIDKWRADPKLMGYKLQSNSYKFSWLLIPLSLPFVWLLFFWKRRPRFAMYDHAVFVTYSLSFMTLFYVALVVLGSLGVSNGWLLLLGVFVPLLHIYKQLKSTYSLRRFSALWRTAALSIFIFVIVFLFVDALLVIGAFG
jgi:hypothetical protein